jgi:hypothetical protein
MKKPVFISGGMPEGREFFLPDKGSSFAARSNPDRLQGKPARYGGKKAVQTAFSGCEYRFCSNPRKS